MKAFNFGKFSLTAPELWSDVSMFFEQDEEGNKPIAISPDDETFMDFLLIIEPDKERHQMDYLFRELIIIGRKRKFKMRMPQKVIKLIGKYDVCGATYYAEEEYHRYWFLSDGYSILKISLHSETRFESHYDKILEEIMKSIEFK